MSAAVAYQEPEWWGAQTPRIYCAPDYVTSRIDEVMELATACGLPLDEWQQFVLRNALGLDENGQFTAFEVGLNVPRQNGKGVILRVRELAGVLLFGEEYITHSAQVQDTSLDHMQRLLDDLEEGGLQGELKGKPRWANGQEALKFKGNRTIRFRTRSSRGGRGFSGSPIILDEAMFLHESARNALIPMMTTKEKPQVWYAGSAADQEEMEHSVVWADVRERGIAGNSPSLAYFEWSANVDRIEDVPETLNMDLVAQANPSLGIRITQRYIEMEHDTLSHRGHAVERLGVGDYPSTAGLQSVIDREVWGSLTDADSEALDPVCMAFDVSPERRSAVAIAGRTSDGLWHVEVIEAKTGTKWLPEFLAEKVERNEPLVVICDEYGPSGSMVGQIEDAGVKVETVNAQEHGQACGLLVDAIENRELRHIGQTSLANAIKGAAARPLGDAWAWSRKNSNVDISPLVAVTLALSAAMERVDQAGEMTIY